MELKLENFVEDLKKYNAGEIECKFDFLQDGSRYQACISVKSFEEEEQEDDNSEN